MSPLPRITPSDVLDAVRSMADAERAELRRLIFAAPSTDARDAGNPSPDGPARTPFDDPDHRD